MTKAGTTSAPERSERVSIGELLGQLASDSAALIHDEMDLAKRELGDRVRSLRSGMTILAVGALILQIALFALCITAIIGLSPVMGVGSAALTVSIVLLLGGGIAVFMGVRRVQRTSLRPEQTIETLEENKQWLKELTH